MAAKRYRSPEHRTFHRAASYTEGRSMKRSRDERAIKRKSTFGRLVAAGEWAVSEWGALVRLWNLGLPVPYPVQIDGTEIMMEWITVLDEDGAVQTAPRLAQTRPSPELLAAYFEQLTDALAIMVQNGVVHGDLSAYNILAAGERLVIIDLPQIVDLVGNLNGMDFLLRDCANICAWFRSRGLERRRARAVRGADGARVLTTSIGAIGGGNDRSSTRRRIDGRLGCGREAQPRAGRAGRVARRLRPPGRGGRDPAQRLAGGRGGPERPWRGAGRAAGRRSDVPRLHLRARRRGADRGRGRRWCCRR